MKIVEFANEIVPEPQPTSRKSTRLSGEPLNEFEIKLTEEEKEDKLAQFIVRICEVLGSSGWNTPKVLQMLEKNKWNVKKALLTVKKNKTFYSEYFL